MSKIKLTKGELKKQRDSLKQFKRYLPTLQLKKQQLQMKVTEARRELAKVEAEFEEVKQYIEQWVGILADGDIDLKDWVLPTDIKLSTINVAGANIPVLDDLVFNEAEIGFYAMPLWVDMAVEKLREFMKAMVTVHVVKLQLEKLEHELRVTTQRVNLFEKVKIPECQDNIRVIRIYLGDQQANSVGISKVAKGKLVAAEAAA